MIIAEIKAKEQLYHINFPVGTSLDYAYDYAKAIAEGREVHKTETEVLDINTGSYDHIRVYVENETGNPYPVVLPPTSQPVGNDPLRIERSQLELLGQRIDLEAAVYQTDVTTFVLPFRINGSPAYKVVSEKSMKDLIKSFGQAGKYVPVTAVMPHGPIYDEAEALAFVKDYAEETEAERERLLQDTDKTARAIELKGE